MSTPRKPATPSPKRASTAPGASEGASSRSESTAEPATTATVGASGSDVAEPQFRVYKPPATAAPQEALPDDYFTPTVAELKARQEQLHARAVALNSAPLLTRAQREEQSKTKRDRWPNTTIRVRFPDRTQLERTFPSRDKIRSVYAFVRDSLREDVKPVKFVLSSSPPPRQLKVSDHTVRDLTLADLGLAPSSVLNLRFVDDAWNRSDLPAPLASTILEHAVDLPTLAGFDGNQKKKEGSSASGSNRAQASTGGDVKLPKWLKLGFKK
ncbi:ubiquitin-related domain-containing protein [Russula earlei]|uniref:Ubiquitin-related domain-containing protein n=1 Tax=Russula earlei TaxID=71964 RepID=A0ACC0U5P6_9AGAM|nr:ubiquitin-related domain-containing protein [Russula earlei]